MKEKMNEKMKRRNERKDNFFSKNVSRPPNPPDELAQNVSKKNPRRTNYSFIFHAKVQNLTVSSIIYMTRIRFFGPGGINSEWVRARTVVMSATNVSSPCCTHEVGTWKLLTVPLTHLHTFVPGSTVQRLLRRSSGLLWQGVLVPGS